MTRTVPFVVILVLAANSWNIPSAAVSQSAGTQAAPADTPPTLPDVVARVNGSDISRADLEAAVRQLESHSGPAGSEEQRNQMVRDVLDQLVGYQLLLQESVSRRVAVPEAEIDGRISQIRAQFPSQEAFTQALDMQKTTLTELRNKSREGMQIETMLQGELAAKIAVTPAQVTEFYEKNVSEFKQGERVRASHILIRVPQNADPAAKEQGRAKAAAVLAEIKAGGDFAAIAKQRSEDPGTAPNDGDLGFFERGQMVGPFEQAAFALAPAQTSDLVESPFGYHIIRVTQKQAAGTTPIADVRAQIEQYLEGQSKEQLTRIFVESLKTKSKVEIYL